MANDDILSELGSIVGIGVGSIEVMLVKQSFTVGETIHGRLQCKLSRPTEADKLVIGFRGTRDRMSTVRDAYGVKRQERSTDTIYEFEQQLDGKRKNYQSDAYDFHLPIPPDAVQGPLRPPEGALGDVLRVVSTISSLMDAGPRPIVWQVYAILHIPWKVNVKHYVQISVAPKG